MIELVGSVKNYLVQGMKMQIKPYGLIFISLFLFVSAQASGGTVTTGWLYIDQILLGWNVKRLNYTFDQTLPNPANCSIASGGSVDEDQVNLDHIYSLSLVAFSAHKPVQLVLADDACSFNGRVKIVSLNAKN